eukprot:7159899-Prymnesium_polylepis.1
MAPFHSHRSIHTEGSQHPSATRPYPAERLCAEFHTGVPAPAHPFRITRAAIQLWLLLVAGVLRHEGMGTEEEPLGPLDDLLSV